MRVSVSQLLLLNVLRVSLLILRILQAEKRTDLSFVSALFSHFFQRLARLRVFNYTNSVSGAFCCLRATGFIIASFVTSSVAGYDHTQSTAIYGLSDCPGLY